MYFRCRVNVEYIDPYIDPVVISTDGETCACDQHNMSLKMHARKYLRITVFTR